MVIQVQDPTHLRPAIAKDVVYQVARAVNATACPRPIQVWTEDVANIVLVKAPPESGEALRTTPQKAMARRALPPDSFPKAEMLLRAHYSLSNDRWGSVRLTFGNDSEFKNMCQLRDHRCAFC